MKVSAPTPRASIGLSQWRASIVDVDAEGIDRDDAIERIGDLGDDGAGVQVGEDGLGHPEQLSLAVELLVEGLLLGAHPLRAVGIDHGLRGDGGVDAEIAQVMRREAVEPHLGQDDDADGLVLPDASAPRASIRRVPRRYRAWSRRAGRAPHRAGTGRRHAGRPNP